MEICDTLTTNTRPSGFNVSKIASHKRCTTIVKVLIMLALIVILVAIAVVMTLVVINSTNNTNSGKL